MNIEIVWENMSVKNRYSIRNTVFCKDSFRLIHSFLFFSHKKIPLLKIFLFNNIIGELTWIVNI